MFTHIIYIYIYIYICIYVCISPPPGSRRTGDWRWPRSLRSTHRAAESATTRPGTLWLLRSRAPGAGWESPGPQLRFIHIHQWLRIQYTCFELDTVNIDWWICIYFRLVPGWTGSGAADAPPQRLAAQKLGCTPWGVRAVRLLRVWISEGLTQANS